MDTILHEPRLVQDYHEEYLRLVNTFHNVARTGVFVKYYNINILQSTYEQYLESTFDIYGISDIKFDIYDIVPVYFVQAIQNRSNNVTDLKGQMMDGASSIVSYVIPRPRIHDLIVFYPPVGSGEILRVANLMTPVNTLHSNPSWNWFELELNYAPLKTLDNLKINNRYVYDLSDEKIIGLQNYREKISSLQNIQGIIKELSSFYSTINDVYIADGVIPLAANEIILFFKKKYGTQYRRLFEKYKSPFGYENYVGSSLYYGSINELPYKDMSNNAYYVYNLETQEIELYSWEHKEEEHISNDIEQLLYLGYQLYHRMI